MVEEKWTYPNSFKKKVGKTKAHVGCFGEGGGIEFNEFLERIEDLGPDLDERKDCQGKRT